MFETGVSKQLSPPISLPVTSHSLYEDSISLRINLSFIVIAFCYHSINCPFPLKVPEILYPFPVLVTVNSLDVRAASGMQLPVVRKGNDGWFGADYENHDYKYEYIVTGPGNASS